MVFVVGWAAPDPGCVFRGGRPVVGAPADISEAGGDRLPPRPVGSSRPGDGMGNFVQEHLMDVVVIKSRGEMPRHGDALFGESTHAGAGLGVVESEAPGWVEVQGDERIRPPSHSLEISHAGRLPSPGDGPADHASAGDGSASAPSGDDAASIDERSSSDPIAIIVLSIQIGDA